MEDAGLRAEIEVDLLAWVAQRHRVTSPAQLGDKARKVVAQRDATAAARRLAKALKERGVSIRPERAEGMAAVTVVCTLPEARAFHQALVQCAEALVDDPDGPVRTRGQKMVDALLDLVLRPGETELPPVQVLLTVVASMGTMLDGDAPAEVDGELVPAEMARQLVQALAGRGHRLAGTESGADASRSTTGAESAAPSSGEPVSAGEEPAAAGSLDWFDDEAWWAEAERRIAANDFSGEGLPGWSQFIGEAVDSREPYWSQAVDAPGWPIDPTASTPWADDDGPPDPGATPDDGTAPDLDPPAGLDWSSGGGWWATADRAVEDAGAAVHAARLALGHAQRSVRTATKAAAAEEDTWQATPAGRVDAAGDALAAAADAQREDLADLLAMIAGGGLADRPRIAIADAITSAFGTLTDLPDLRRAAHCGQRACRRRPETCSHDLTGRPGLRAPGPTDGYAAGGDTAAANLAGYCTGDHRGKHQVPGWTHTLTPDGTLTVTTPTGLTAVTTPPPY